MSRVDEIAATIFDRKPAVALKSEVVDTRTADLHAVYTRVLKTMAHPRYLTPRELAEISGVSMKDIYYLRKRALLRGWRVPGKRQIKFTMEDLMNVMERT